MHTIRDIKDSEYPACVGLINRTGAYNHMVLARITGARVLGVFDEDNKLFGCVMLMVTGPQAYIDYLCIEAKQGNKGYGTELVAHAIACLQVEGVNTVHAIVGTANTPMLHMLDKYKPKADYPYIVVTLHMLGDDSGQDDNANN